MLQQPRARDLGIQLPGRTGEHNAITDVPGVTVGYTTLIEGADVRTGVTAILPRGRDHATLPCAAGRSVLNGNGEMTGSAWLDETGSLSLPILITNTHSVGAAHEGAVAWTARNHPGQANQWLLPVVAETWDGYLNDINGLHVRPEHAIATIDSASGGPVAEGSVGGGTGMNCYGFKGGSGTSSRLIGYGDSTYTVGAFVQANFGSRKELVIAGEPVGRALGEDNPMESSDWFANQGAGSVIVVIATDAPLLPDQCQALARRVPLGLARTGTAGSHFSGDIFLAFSTANQGALRSEMGDAAAREERYDTLRFIPWGQLDPLLTAVVESVEEAVLNAIFAGKEMIGRAGHRSPGLPVPAVLEMLGIRAPQQATAG
ncbi:P1 family peptidase [Saxibacter everestensis]|uniref:P1 family peptidase n=1 Tax=Saxibacter everestensis TaxID=2909229 RepID=A0ABY8QW03_9MICO|nr:P1 family peptidase [Brevibacteriaceae bacterium ZFBP1038]